MHRMMIMIPVSFDWFQIIMHILKMVLWNGTPCTLHLSKSVTKHLNLIISGMIVDVFTDYGVIVILFGTFEAFHMIIEYFLVFGKGPAP